MKTTAIFLPLCLLGTALSLFAQTTITDPRITSWLTDASGGYARLYESDAAKAAGNALVTWSRGAGVQSTPVYAGVTQVQYSTSWVYLRTTGLGYHIMGPWYINGAHTIDFPSFPANQNVLYRIPRTPSVAASKTLTSPGPIGYGVDGVSLYDMGDTFSYSTASGADAQPTNGIRGDGIWNRDAFVNEGGSFDAAFAHQSNSNYHYHANMPALRYLVGDNVTYNTATKAYTENSAPATKHSPILGWMKDGYPLYGPYGYSSAMDASSGIRRMISGYVKRDGTNGTANLSATGRITLPTWALAVQNRTSTALASTQYGPAVNSTSYTLGHYQEDYDYLGNLGKTHGVDFDLDLYNGRFCVTPEFPSGTYAYFVPIEADGTPKFPYVIGRQFYGNTTGGAVTSITETVTEYERGAPAAAITLTGTASGSQVALIWNSAEGATYKLESSSDGTTYTTIASAVISGGMSTAITTSQANYYRVTLTAIATYDTTAIVGMPVGTNVTLHYTTSGSSSTGTASAATTTAATTTTTTTTPTMPPAVVASTTTSTATSSGGGGGAPSHWFIGALALLTGWRRWRVRQG